MYRIPLFLLSMFLLTTAAAPPAPVVVERDFAAQFARHGVQGSFLLFDAPAGQYVAYNPRRCRQRFLPASTFKIPNTLIGLQTGALPDTAEICRWDGVTRSFPQWNQDMTYARALRVSCVPCYRQLARRIGVARYWQWLPRLGYPGMVITPATLDTFWLGGRSRISQFEQVAFLRRLQAETLPVEVRHQRAVKQLLLLKKTPEYALYGKSGWRFRSAHNPDNGWLVGWVERPDGRRAYFALNVEPLPGPPNDDQFLASRRAVTEAILQELGWL